MTDLNLVLFNKFTSKYFNLQLFTFLILLLIPKYPLIGKVTDNGLLLLSFFYSIVIIYTIYQIKKYTANILDLMIILLFSILIFKKALSHQFGYENVCGLLLYLCVRNSRINTKTLFNVFISVLAILLIYIVCQYFSIIESNNTYFTITGPFNNPNPLSIFLAALNIFIIMKIFSLQNKLYFNISCLIVIATSILLIYMSCRSALLAIFITALLYHRDAFKILNLKNKIAISIGACAIVFVGYYVKPESTKGRLFIWDICYKMFSKNMLFGVGQDKFQVNYAEIQSFLFSIPENKKKFSSFAGYMDYAFCDILQFICENGILISIYLLVLIIIHLMTFLPFFKKNKKSSTDCGIFSILLVLIIASLFNYVFYVVQLNFLFIILLALNSKTNSKLLFSRHEFRFKIRALMLIFGGSLFIYTGFLIIVYLKLNTTKYDPESKKNTLHEFDSKYRYLNNDFFYLYQLALLYNNDGSDSSRKKAFILLRKSNEIYSNKNSNHLLAYMYQGIHDYQSAERELLFVYNNLPNKIRPKYLLFRHYKLSREKIKREKIYYEIQNFPCKNEADIYVQKLTKKEFYEKNFQ